MLHHGATRLLRAVLGVGLSLALSVVTAGCGGPIEPASTPCPEVHEALGCVDGATLAPRPGDPFPASPVGLMERVERALDLAGEVWGAEPADYLAGWTIEISGGWFACGVNWTYGCVEPGSRRIKAAPGFANCLPGVLIHEFGHVLIGDGGHEDPRFESADALEGAPCE